MADKSKIEWTDATWTPIRARHRESRKVGWHCEHVSEGCRNCYAETINRRLGARLAYKPGHRKDIDLFLDEKMLLAPLRWRKPRRIFVCSMTDLFADFVADEWIDHIFAVMALCPLHTFQVLTKRPERMLAWFAGAKERVFHQLIRLQIYDTGYVWPLPNVWLGVSVEDQWAANERIPYLLTTPAAVRFLSMEPLLGPVDLNRIHEQFDGGLSHSWESCLNGRRFDPWVDGGDVVGFPKIDWVIVGGESGPGARPMHPDWARSVRDQCAEAGTPFFFKQWGEWQPFLSGGEVGTFIAHGRKFSGSSLHRFDDGQYLARVGKKAAGRLLGGVTHDGAPT